MLPYMENDDIYLVKMYDVENQSTCTIPQMLMADRKEIYHCKHNTYTFVRYTLRI